MPVPASSGAEKPERKQNPFRVSLGDRRVGCDRGAGTGLSGVSLTRHRQTPNTAVRCRGPEPGATTRLLCRSGLRTIFRDPTRESTFRLANEGADCTFKLGKVALHGSCQDGV